MAENKSVRKLRTWACPICGWSMSDLAYLLIRADVGCPRCAVPFARFVSRYFEFTQPQEVSPNEITPGQ